MAMPALSSEERNIALSVAVAALPPGGALPGADGETVERFERWMSHAEAVQATAVRGMLWAVEYGAVAETAHRFSTLPRERASALLERWAERGVLAKRLLVRMLLAPIKTSHFDSEALFEKVQCPSFHDSKKHLRVVESPRWLARVTDGRAVDADAELACEVVIVGTGAGGAACAFELAGRGRAVLMLEEGDYHRRESFFGRSFEARDKLYRDNGVTIALGNANIPLFVGKAVGGTTLINSGTCFRAPERVFETWRNEHGLAWASHTSMAPYYTRVESMLEVGTSSMQLTGGVGRVIARGASALGLSHGILPRNAPGCDGQGVCVWGCPTGAKRSTDVSYVPEALKLGAELFTAAKVTRLLIENGRAVGVVATLGSGRTLRVRAQAVVVAAGTLMTPLLMRNAGVLERSRALGRNLSLHPAQKVFGLFDEVIDMGSSIPQGYGIDELSEQGIMFEGASVPFDIFAVASSQIGRRYMRFMEAYRHTAAFGFMIEDTGRGSVRPGLGGMPMVTYQLSREDTARIQRGTALLCEVFLAAGAKKAITFIHGQDEVRSARDIGRLKASRLHPSDFELAAFHPLGTARMGSDPRTSVVGPNQEAHELPGLYLCDGSVVPTPLGVNPQMTIMALGHRAGEIVDAELPGS